MAGGILLTGGTGYLGSRLVPRLAARGHAVTALARSGSESRLPPGAKAVAGDPLDAAALRAALPGHSTWVQLIGTPRPAPWKAARFRAVDLRAAQAMAETAPGSSLRHLVYLSVAQPAPIMAAYVSVRAQGEALLQATGIPCTFLRPWYVLGPGHRWPYAFIPLYALLERIPATRERALRFGLVTLDRMLSALVHAIENPPPAIRILDAQAIRLTPPQ